MRRLVVVLLAAAAAVAATPVRAGALHSGPPNEGLIVVGLPIEEARALAEESAFGVGLGVFPDSRDAVAFIDEMARGPVTGPPGSLAAVGRDRRSLRLRLDDAPRFQFQGGEAVPRPVTIGVWLSPTVRHHPVAALARAFTPDGGDPENRVPLDAVAKRDVSVGVLGSMEDARDFIVLDERNRYIVVVGVGVRTPVLVALSLRPRSFLTGALHVLPRLRRGDRYQQSFLRGEAAGREGIVTPSDLASYILSAAVHSDPYTIPDGIRGSILIGHFGTALDRYDELEARFVRDEDFGTGLTGATVAAGLGGLLVAAAVSLRRSRWLTALFLRGAAMAPAGYLAGLFVQDARWQVRAIAVVGAFLVGAAFALPWTRKTLGWILLVTTAAAVGLTLTAAARHGPIAPSYAGRGLGGMNEPSLSLWGNPLISWRFFGLRNHLAAFLAGGFLAGASLAALPTAAIAVGALGVGVVVGAPGLGANFIGVVTLALGTAALLLARAAGRPRPLHVPIAAVFAGACGVAALLADRAATTHGGRAVEAIRTGGAEVVWQIFSHRARLNYREMADIGGIAFVALALLVVGLAAFYAWSIASSGGLRLRAAVAGTALAALAAIVIEDSGFLTGGILALYPALAFVAARADPEPGVGASVIEPPPGFV